MAGPGASAPQAAAPSLLETGEQAVENLPGSIVQNVGQMLSPLRHPIDTAKSFGDLAEGLEAYAVDAAGIKGGPQFESEKNAAKEHVNRLVDFFKDRYGSYDNFKRTFAKDPAGVLVDASMLATGGGGLLERAPGVIGKIGEATRVAGETINPLSTAGLQKLPGGVGRKIGNVQAQIGRAATALPGQLARHAVGFATGVGEQALKTAYEAGQRGGSYGQAFLDSMRDKNFPIDHVVNLGKKALAEMRADKMAQYLQNRPNWVKQNPVILSWNDIDAHMAHAETISKYEGQEIRASTANVRAQINDLITRWKSGNPLKMYTAEGFDALKQAIGDIKNNIAWENRSARAVANEAYHAVRETIAKQEPAYAQAMRDYESASREIEEIEKSFSLKGEKTNVDTALRKLQSIMRDNVQTNYGRRGQLGKRLAQTTAAERLMPHLAGSALGAELPRGLASRLLAGGGAGLTYLLHPYALPGFAMSSPRLMGETFHAAGRASPYVKAAARTARRVAPSRTQLLATQRATAPNIMDQFSPNPYDQLGMQPDDQQPQ